MILEKKENKKKEDVKPMRKISNNKGGRGNRFTLLIITAILLITTVLHTQQTRASTNLINEEWRYPGDSFIINNQLFTLTEGKDCYQIGLTKKDNTYIITYPNCVESYDHLEKYCYEATGCPDDEDHIKYEAGKRIYGAKIAIYNLTPTISTKHEVENSKPKIGDQVRITFTITNDGEKSISDGLFEEEIPSELKIISKPTDVTQRGNKLTKKIILSPGKSETLSYVVEVKDYLSEYLTPTITYTYEGRKISVEGERAKITVPSPYEITVTATPKTSGLNKETTYQLEIKNNDGENDLKLNAKIIGFSNDKITITGYEAKNAEKKEDNTINWQTTIKPGDTKELTIKILPQKTGERLIKAELNMTFEKEGKIQKTFNKEYTKKLIIPDVKPKITTNLPKTLYEETEYPLVITVQNTNKINSMYKVRGYLKILNNEKTYPLKETEIIGPEKKAIMLDERIMTPSIEKDQPLEMIIKLKYELITGEKKEAEQKIKISMKNQKQPYEIIKESNQTTIKPGDSFRVKVEVKNEKEEYATIEVWEEIPDNTFIKSGITKTEISLNKREKKQAYIYELKIPDNYEGENLTITTYLKNKLTGEEYSEKEEYKIMRENQTKKNDKEDEKRTEKKEDNKKIEQKEDEGIIEKIINGIADFFSKLFG